ncbi:hypothetical protein FisN_15Lh216 [Fistulifera solaris]|uniref:Uncharacterized protein n=1 Tax=Fistulifera solaris TaxID=1519565 RepID=A0A1Z5JDY3_FISSO|nr:hypothetical protein FisN_15Lh216 [Fistulifera solaris]|eukprot:GAX12092.1 hypothetical protein FisN_15Lh216 [Fistulifera solaris]
MPNNGHSGFIHERAINLARRGSVQNENDLMQEDMFDSTMDMKHVYNHDYCKELACHMIHLKSLPMECMKFTDVSSDLRRRDTDTTHPTQILS